MNTEGDPPGSRISQIFADKPLDDGAAKEIARLSEQVEALKDKLGDTIFSFVFVIVLIIDLFVFPNLQNWAAPIVIGLLQFMFLFSLARACRVNDVVRLTETLLDALDRWRGNKPDSNGRA